MKDFIEETLREAGAMALSLAPDAKGERKAEDAIFNIRVAGCLIVHDNV